MTLLALIFAAAEAASPGSASAQALDLNGMNFIDGDTIKTIFAFLGMAVTGLFTYLKMKATMERKVDEAIQQTKTTIANDPLRIEQTSYQATMKKNDAALNDDTFISEADLKELEALAKRVEDRSEYGGGLILSLVNMYRNVKGV